MSIPDPNKPKVVIVGGGFGGLYAAKTLAGKPVQVELIDKRNFHLFQPLLYQVATGSLSPGDIASPLRSVLGCYGNIHIRMDEVLDIHPQAKQLSLRHYPVPITYDYLVLATGSTTSYFGHPDWEEGTLGLKTVEDALFMRKRILEAFEAAEYETHPRKRKQLLTFVIVGGGPTGVELAGALAELVRYSLKHEFKSISTDEVRILLVEAAPFILGTYPPDLAKKAAFALQRRGVDIRTGMLVTDIRDQHITLSQGTQSETLLAGTILWAAGVKASPLGQILAEKTGCQLDKSGRVLVNPDCTVPGYTDLFVIGDLAHYAHTPDQKPLPGVAPVAMQQGAYVARVILARQGGETLEPFQYRDRGNLAVIGINEAVADLGRFRLSGFLAWLIWALVHIANLIEFDNKLLVMIQWAWQYLTRKTSARLITGG